MKTPRRVAAPGGVLTPHSFAFIPWLTLTLACSETPKSSENAGSVGGTGSTGAAGSGGSGARAGNGGGHAGLAGSSGTAATGGAAGGTALAGAGATAPDDTDGDDDRPDDDDELTVTTDAGPRHEQGDASTASASDAGPDCTPFVMPESCVIPDGAVLPESLDCTGLYETVGAPMRDGALHCGVVAYAPAYPLWSDGLNKRRFVYIPMGAKVDVTEPDSFDYPLGTQFWKEFRQPEELGGKLAETRLMRKVDGGWLYTTYVWNEDETQATQLNDGIADLQGSGHTVPSREECKECHSGRPDFILGWDGIMLGTGASGLTRDDLLTRNLITWQGVEEGAPSPLSQVVPGDETERAALGYLHANCGVSCHNGTGQALALETGFFTRLDADTLDSVQTTLTYATGLERSPSPNAPLSDLSLPASGQDYVDVRPLRPEESLLFVRMTLRGQDAAMPRLGTNLVDEEAVNLVRAFIEGMTPERGY